MQKEKSVRTYQRKSKNGKVVTVRSYKAKYDAAEEARKEMAKRAGAGDELKKKKSAAPADLGFTADEFKIWANDLDEKEAKRIDKILVKKYGEKAVQKLADEINAGNSRTYKAVFARLSSEKPNESKKDRVVDDFLSGKDVSKQLTEKKSSRKTTKVGKGEYQTGMKVANKKLSAKEQKLVDKILDENKGELDKEYLEAFYPEVSKKVHEAVIKAQSAKSLKEKPVKKVAIKTANSLPEIKIPEKPKLRDKNFSSKISDYNAALDYRDYREAVLRGDKKAISDAKYNLTGYLREEADSTSLTRKISKLTGIPLGASRGASKSSKESSAKSKVDYNSFAEKKLKKYKSWKVSKQGSGYVLTNPNSDPYRSPETLRVSPSFAASLMEYQKGNKAAIKSYAVTLKKEDKKGSAEHEKRTSEKPKTKSSDAMPKSRPTDAPKSQRDSYERHVSSQISGSHQTLSQIMETLASSGKWSDDEKMRRAAQRIYDKQK